MSDPVLERCALCPRLCRSACPVASSTAREAAAPTVIAEVLLAWSRGRLPDAVARDAATLCVDCGGCEAFCHLGAPLPEALRAARAALVPVERVEPLRAVVGEGRRVAIEADERAWSAALASRLGEPVAAWATRDALGVILVGRPAWSERAAAIRDALAGREAVVADGEVARALRAVGVSWRWLHELIGVDGRPSCVQGASGRDGCCGGARPLADRHLSDARRMASRWQLGEHARVGDAVCARALRAVGREVPDMIDALLAGVGEAG